MFHIHFGKDSLLGETGLFRRAGPGRFFRFVPSLVIFKIEAKFFEGFDMIFLFVDHAYIVA